MKLKLREQEAEYLALQAQISPHFLYNTLNSISVCCESGDTVSSSKMCVQLSDIMRYITSNNKQSTIESEIDNVRNYLELMCVPYEGLLKYDIDVNEHMLKLYTPKLILQPLVENSINHGLSGIAFPWFIKIKGTLENDIWKISVRDFGSGFSNQSLNNLKQQINSYKSNLVKGNLAETQQKGSMGILNIFSRIYIIFKESTIFRIENREIGSEVIIGGSVKIARSLEKGYLEHD